MTPEEIAHALRQEAECVDSPEQMKRLERLADEVWALDVHMATCVTHKLTPEEHKIGPNTYVGCDG